MKIAAVKHIPTGHYSTPHKKQVSYAYLYLLIGLLPMLMSRHSHILFLLAPSAVQLSKNLWHKPLRLLGASKTLRLTKVLWESWIKVCYGFLWKVFLFSNTCAPDMPSCQTEKKNLSGVLTGTGISSYVAKESIQMPNTQITSFFSHLKIIRSPATVCSHKQNPQKPVMPTGTNIFIIKK